MLLVTVMARTREGAAAIRRATPGCEIPASPSVHVAHASWLTEVGDSFLKPTMRRFAPVLLVGALVTIPVGVDVEP